MSPKVLIFLTPIEQELERGEAVQRTKLRQSATAQMRQKGFFRFEANKLPGVAVIDLR